LYNASKLEFVIEQRIVEAEEAGYSQIVTDLLYALFWLRRLYLDEDSSDYTIEEIAVDVIMATAQEARAEASRLNDLCKPSS
jgi:hypothetical protein